MQKVGEDVRRFIIDNYLFGRTDVVLDDDASFIEMGIIDSTGVLELVTFLEDKYQIKVEDEELLPSNLDSLNNIIRFLTEKCPAVASHGR